MIRILISIVFFYLSTAVIIGTLADLKLNPGAHPNLSGRIKTVGQFFSFAFIIFLVGWLIWPNRDHIVYPRYYIGNVVKTTEGVSIKVRIKKELKNEELATIISKIKQDSSHLKCTLILFYLPGQAYNNQPYAEYISSYDDEIWDKVSNVFNHRTNGIVIKARK